MNEESGAPSPVPQRDGPADGPERQVEIRCGFAEQAQREADAAAARVAEVRRLCDEQASVLAAAQSDVDPGVTRAAKEKAHAAFRSAVAAARSRGQVESAAVAWLAEINRINGRGRTALARIASATIEAGVLQDRLARLSDSAESTALMAVAAAEACRAAQAKLDAANAAHENPAAAAPMDGAWTPEVPELGEAAARRQAGGDEATTANTALPAAVLLAAEAAGAGAAPSAAGNSTPSTNWLAIDLDSPHPQVIIRLVRRDDPTMSALVDRLAGSDATARARWQLNLSTFVDSVVAAAIDESCIEFARGNPFWDQFSAAECREIAHGLAALGFRYDGFGSFVDGRVPSNRELALAVGQAGLLPVKIRYWPTAEEAGFLFQVVSVSADTFIAARAPALMLGECVRMLGRRAEYLADLWNDWPHCRPLLLSTGL